MDVNEATFEAAVIQRSHQLPVVVDFWASWCGPCLRLGPVIERAIEARKGKLELAKVDVDANPRLASAFRIQGIPAVKAFKNGSVVAEFTGAQQPAAVEQFLERLLPSEADQLVQRGDEDSLRRAVELEPGRADAAVPLARALHGRGEDEQALEVLAGVPGNFAAEGLSARIVLERDRLDLRQAFSALDQGDTERGLELLLAALQSSDGARDDLRRVIVGVLDELGVEHPLARDTRRKLAAALY